MMYDREPRPGDGPEYHEEHRWWLARQPMKWRVRKSLYNTFRAQWVAELYDKDVQIGQTWRFRTWRSAMDWVTNR